nr:retrovirus-related Pol polyprotein from transposon TNT 1-94 [Tanacetum cinerariifolium]
MIRHDYDITSSLRRGALQILSRRFFLNRIYLITSQSSQICRILKDGGEAIMGYGDLQMGNILISRVYCVEGIGHNLFSIGQFCDSDLEVAFRKHTCFVHNLEGVDLLLESRGSNLYTISMADMMKSALILLLFKASKRKSWLWHQEVGITHNTSTTRTPQQNGVVKRRNRTLVEAVRTMLIFSKSLLFLWAKAVATACYTQNRSLIRTRYNKTPYELLRDRKPKLNVVSTPISTATLLPPDTARASSSSSSSIDKDAPSPAKAELENYKEAIEESCHAREYP